MKISQIVTLVIALQVLAAMARAGTLSRGPEQDDRFPLDLLLVLAHPDDEIFVAPYLARAVLDEHRHVGVVYVTRGDAGENSVGPAQGEALAAIREVEARSAWAAWGVPWVWFLAGADTASQNVLRSLESWRRFPIQEQLVRFVRLTRPTVVMTFLPSYQVGENHADHQATAVMATEAFDLAGDPAAFAHQVTPARRLPFSWPTAEGLEPWQPQKLYYFSDAQDRSLFVGLGPEYDSRAISPSQKVPYVRLAAQEASFHRTQEFPGQLALRCLASGNFQTMTRPDRMLLAKSLVGGKVTEDVFAGVRREGIPFQRPRAARTGPAGLTLEWGGPWGFYRSFWPAHDLEQLEKIHFPEAAMGADRVLPVQLVIENPAWAPETISISAKLPANWAVMDGGGEAIVAAHTTLACAMTITAPASAPQGWGTVTFQLHSGTKLITSLPLRVYLSSGGLPLN